MNVEEGGIDVMQEPNRPPSLIEDQPPPEAMLNSEQVEECKVPEAANESEAELEAAPVQAENVDGGNGGCEVGDASLPAERSSDVIGDANIPVIKDELVLENECKGQDETSRVTETEVDALIGGVEDSVTAEKYGGGLEERLDIPESFQYGEEGRESIEEGKTMEEDEVAGEDFLKAKESSAEGETDNERKGQVDKLDLLEEVLKVEESRPIGEEKEKLDGDGESERYMEPDGESKVVEETAEVDVKMDGDRYMEEADGSEINDHDLLPLALLQDDMIEDGKTDAVDPEIKVVDENEIELEGQRKELKDEEGDEEEEDEEMEVEEEREVEGEVEKEEEGREVEDQLEKETETEEEREVEGDAEKETEEEEEREVDAHEEKEMEDMETEETADGGSGKRKRVRNSKVLTRGPTRKTVGEDICFICLDGGDIVLCDRRGCPKAYHLSCADLDDDFFQSKSRWNCGWHFCRQCKKNAHVMCYTCQFSLCKGCAKGDTTFICVRGNKGLCETCIKSVMLIENSERNDNTDQAAVDDRSSVNYLFKDYWAEQKERLSLTLDEITQATNRWKSCNADSESFLGNAETPDSKRNTPKKRTRSSTKEVHNDVDDSSGKAEASGARKGKRRLKSQSEDADSDSENSSKDHAGNGPRGRKAKKLLKTRAFEIDSASHSNNGGISSQSGTEWATKELLEFVVHMKDGDASPLSQFDVQELLLEYIQRNKLRDPRRKSQIVCDAMLQKLFGKQRVGHFEMLKLLELHFLSKEDSQADDNQGSVVDAEGSQLDADENADSLTDVGKYKGRKSRKKGDGRGLQSNLDDYAAIDMHNITLIYLRRNLLEALLEDSEGFHEKVVGAFVRIRIPGNNQKQDIYRLVQVLGTNKAEPYKVGKRIAYCMLEILNLNKTEVISIDTISNQDFTEDECKRLRQSIKCGLISRLTVGDVLDKAKDLQAVRVNDWLETEVTRLNHLRDRASDLGRKKELRECVEKLQLLSTTEERQRRLDEIPEVHADPNMDPSHESEDESEPEEKGQESTPRARETSFLWREREHFPSRKGDSTSTDPWSLTAKVSTRNWEPSRSLPGKGFSSRPEDTSVAEDSFHGSPWSPVKPSPHSTSSETFRTTPDSLTAKLGHYSETRTNSSASAPLETSLLVSATPVQHAVKISDSEKLWHYKDPTGKGQGPFSIVQLRKWNKNGYFPANLQIWRTAQSDEDSILLVDALAGRFEKQPSRMVTKSFETPSHQTYRGQSISLMKADQHPGARNTRDAMDQMSPGMQRSRSDTSSKGYDDSPNLSSTPSQSTTSGWTGKSKVSRWSGSPTPIQLPSPSPVANGMLPSPTPESRQVVGSPVYDRNKGFSRSYMTQQSTKDTASLPRSREDLGIGPGYAQKLSSQSTAASGTPMVHAATHRTLQPVTDTTASTNNIHGLSNSGGIQPGNGQNPVASAHGWSSGGYMLNPEATNALNTTNVMHPQGQQTPYSQWPNAQVTNSVPPPPLTYGAGLPVNSGTFPAQNPSSALPSQPQWTPQVPVPQPPMQWAAPTTQYQSNSNAAWAPPMQQANPNMNWGAPTGPSPAGPYGSHPGATVIQTSGPAPTMQPGNPNMPWQQPAGAGNMNPGWGAPPANPGAPNSGPPGPWNWQPPARPRNRPKNQTPCPFLLKQGRCKKGAKCDFSHN